MRKEVFNLKLVLSFIIGILGVIFLFFNFLYLYAPPVAHPYTVCEKITSAHYDFVEKLPSFLDLIFSFLAYFAFSIFFFLSPLAIFLATKFLKAQRKLAIFVIFLNSINFILSIFIGWLVYGLSTGAM